MPLTPEEDAELKLLQSFAASKLWTWLTEYLDHRLKALIQATCTKDGEVWMNKGAMNEVQRLAKAPQLVVEFYKNRMAHRDDERLTLDPTTDRLNGSD